MIRTIILGIIQGLTEFLPVSSSGHLVILQSHMGITSGGLFLDLMLHAGTLAATLLVFKKEIYNLIKCIPCFFTTNPKEPPVTANSRNNDTLSQKRLLLLILLATIPTGIIGFLFKKPAESLFSSPRLASLMLIVTGFILWFTKYVSPKHTRSQMKWTDAILIGIGQGIAVTPGISRSGTTIATALYRNIEREEAGTFSFLISIPAIAGAILLETIQILKYGGVTSNIGIINVVAGTIVAFLTGYLSLKLLLSIVKKGKLHYFSIYCWVFGIIAMLWR